MTGQKGVRKSSTLTAKSRKEDRRLTPIIFTATLMLQPAAPALTKKNANLQSGQLAKNGRKVHTGNIVSKDVSDFKAVVPQKITNQHTYSPQSHHTQSQHIFQLW